MAGVPAVTLDTYLGEKWSQRAKVGSRSDEQRGEPGKTKGPDAMEARSGAHRDGRGTITDEALLEETGAR